MRWFGDLAVVVTFRQTDPLYTVDLSDPRHPRVVGTLQVPGFSSYLHPVGDGLLVGVGHDATAGGADRGAQAATFDLPDLGRVRRRTARSRSAGPPTCPSPTSTRGRSPTYRGSGCWSRRCRTGRPAAYAVRGPARGRRRHAEPRPASWDARAPPATDGARAAPRRRPGRPGRRRASAWSTYGETACAATSGPCTTSSRRPPSDEVHAAALQYVRKVSGATRPQANQARSTGPCAEVTATTRRLLERAHHHRAAEGPRGGGGQGQGPRRRPLRLSDDPGGPP